MLSVVRCYPKCWCTKADSCS